MSARPFRPGGRPPSDVTGHVLARVVSGIVDDVDLRFPSPPVEQVGVGDGRGRTGGHVTAVVQ